MIHSSSVSGNGRQGQVPFLPEMVDDVYRFILHMTCQPHAAKEIAADVLYRASKRQVFPWKQTKKDTLSVMQQAMHALRGFSVWQEERGRSAYVQKILDASSVHEPGDHDRVIAIADFMRTLPDKQRAVFVLWGVLGWSDDQIEMLVGALAANDAARQVLLQRFTDFAAGKQSLRQADFHATLAPFKHAVLSLEERTMIVESVFVRLRRQSIIVFRMVVASLCAFIIPTAFTSALFLSGPLSLQSEMQLIAAANVLIADDVLQDRQRLAEVEESVQRMAAYHQLEELTALTMELASYAFDEHIAMSRRSEEILETLQGTKVSAEDGTAPQGDVLALDR